MVNYFYFKLNINTLRVIFFFAFLFSTLKVYPQARNYYHYTTQNGLTSNVVYDIFEDKLGFIWIATDQGVSRFDGKNFVNFTSKDGLNDNDVFKIYEDADGRIWFFPFKTDPCYYYQGKIYNHKNDPRIIKNDNEKNWVLSYSYNEVDKNLMFALGSNKENGRMVDFINPENYFYMGESFAPNMTLSHFKINNELFVTDKEAGNIIYKVVNHKLVKVFESTFLKGSKYFLNKENILVHNKFNKTIYKFSIVNQSFKLIDSTKLEYDFRRLILNSSKTHFLGLLTDRGLTNLNQQTDYNVGVNFKEKLWGSIIDKNENTWYYTNSNGIYMIPFNKFVYFNSSNCPSILEDRCLSIASLNRKFYIGFENKGVNVFDGNKFKDLKMPLDINKKTRILKLINFQNSVIGVGDNILFKIFTNNTFEKIKLLQSMAFKDIEFRDTSVLFATHNGYANTNYALKNLKTKVRVRYTCIYKLEDGKILLGNLKGVHLAIDTNIKKLNIHPILDEARISDIKQDEKGYIWICTYSDGLFITNLKKTIQVTEFNNNSNPLFLSSSICKDLYFYNGDAWISTNKGINRITLKNFESSNIKILRYTKALGLPYEDINSLVILNDTIYAASSDGLVTFNFNQIKSNLAPISILNTIYVNLKDTLLPNGSYLSSVLNNISFSISGISHTGGEGVKFKYRLKGLNDFWTYTESDKIDFVGLKHGNYQLEVFAVNYDNVESEQPIIYKFTINPPFYLTWWFITISALIFVTVAYVLLRLKINNTREKEKVNSQISELKLQALRAQMNPHFIFNALTSIQYFFSKHDELSANKYMSNFSSLIRQTLNSSRKNFNPLNDEIEILDKYISLEILRLEKPTTYNINIDNAINASEVQVPSMLLQPLIENAIVHGIRHTPDETGDLKINFSMANNKLLIKVIDNGKGINQTKANKQSAGLEITKQRIETLNQIYKLNIDLSINDISDTEPNLHGTMVQLTMMIYNL